MKRILILVSAILFSTLFYQQDIGLNLLLFSLITIGCLALKHPTLFKDKKLILLGMAYLITGITVFMYVATLSLTANIIAFFSLIGATANTRTSIYLNWLNGIYTTIGSFFENMYNNMYLNNSKKKKIDYRYWLKIIGIPFVFIVLFTVLYRNGNPVFDNLIARIDYSFINIPWVLLTVVGYFLFYNISNPVAIEPITTKDISTTNVLYDEGIDKLSVPKLTTEKHIGLALLGALSVLIILFIATDIFHLTKIYTMNAAELSQQVHNGVDALIISNVIAIAIILYFFRGQLNFIKNNDLVNLTKLWIVLNLLVVVSTLLKNTEYIVSFGFTYKRIGVFFFLTITSIGLITTLIKVLRIKNLWYLFRLNLSTAFAILILASTVNWDKTITYYNLNYAEEVDVRYLIRLSDNNTFLLKAFKDDHTLEAILERKIDEKYYNYLLKLKHKNWQELVYDNIIIEK